MSAFARKLDRTYKDTPESFHRRMEDTMYLLAATPRRRNTGKRMSIVIGSIAALLVAFFGLCALFPSIAQAIPGIRSIFATIGKQRQDMQGIDELVGKGDIVLSTPAPATPSPDIPAVAPSDAPVASATPQVFPMTGGNYIIPGEAFLDGGELYISYRYYITDYSRFNDWKGKQSGIDLEPRVFIDGISTEEEGAGFSYSGSYETERNEQEIAQIEEVRDRAQAVLDRGGSGEEYNAVWGTTLTDIDNLDNRMRVGRIVCHLGSVLQDRDEDVLHVTVTFHEIDYGGVGQDNQILASAEYAFDISIAESRKSIKKLKTQRIDQSGLIYEADMEYSPFSLQITLTARLPENASDDAKKLMTRYEKPMNFGFDIRRVGGTRWYADYLVSTGVGPRKELENGISYTHRVRIPSEGLPEAVELVVMASHPGNLQEPADVLTIPIEE